MMMDGLKKMDGNYKVPIADIAHSNVINNSGQNLFIDPDVFR